MTKETLKNIVNSSSKNEELVKRKEIIICDWDNVVQHIDIQWVKLLMDSDYPFKNFMNIPSSEEELNSEEYLKFITSRTNYLIDQFIGIPGKINKETLKKFVELYINDETFYEKCKVIDSTMGIFSSLDFLHSIEKVVFLTKCMKESCLYKKKKIMDILFKKDPRFSMAAVYGKESKGEWAKKNLPTFTMAIDDCTKNIASYLKEDFDSKTYLLPRYGYNSDITSDIFRQAARIRNSEILTYQLEIK